jgi:hypothetical protein
MRAVRMNVVASDAATLTRDQPVAAGQGIQSACGRGDASVTAVDSLRYDPRSRCLRDDRERIGEVASRS